MLPFPLSLVPRRRFPRGLPGLTPVRSNPFPLTSLVLRAWSPSGLDAALLAVDEDRRRQGLGIPSVMA